jgi:pimeloyl-ACP methyl ester carboxylesterase
MRRYLPALGLAVLMVTACSSSQSLAPGTRSVVSAPVRVAHTRLGAVGYRVIGSGPPLVLVMGYGWTMEGWDPRLVHALALHHRVVMFDNSGVGRTQELPQPFSVDAMADQTSALIDTLGLGRPDVLGWSMGGMIAQALAVLHPAQVRRLVLCATYPGSGQAIMPPVDRGIPARSRRVTRHERDSGPRRVRLADRQRRGRARDRTDLGTHAHRRRHQRPAGPDRQ